MQVVEKLSKILCAICGNKFTPDRNNICEACTLAQIDDTALLSVAEDIAFCTYCLRYYRPPWINCYRESKELLAVLLKRVKGINKVTLKSAKFLWTEPHSKRFKLKIEIEREVSEGIRVQQTETVEFVERYTQCPDCKKNFTPHEWNTSVQVRQHVDHKRSLMVLEQNLIRQKFSDKVMKVETVDWGIDFFFRSEHEAQKYVRFIKSNLPVSTKTSKQLISHNERDNTTNVKTTISLTIPKVCKDDLLKLHPMHAKQFGCNGILLCTKVSGSLQFMDVSNYKRVVMTVEEYFVCEPYADIYRLKNYAKTFMVLDNYGRLSEENGGVFATYGLLVTKNYQFEQIFVKSHMNLEIGQEVVGYDFKENSEWHCKNAPDYVFVKKVKAKEDKESRREKDKKEVKEKAGKDINAKAKNSKQKEVLKAKDEGTHPAEEPVYAEAAKEDEPDEQWIDDSSSSEEYT